ncbi:phospholipase D family protein [Thermodesulfovibrio hydrogeniphilus]
MSQKSNLSVFFNNKLHNGSLLDFFDAKRFNKIEVVTYVSSPKFFFNTLKNFKKILLILGVEDTDTQLSFTVDLQEKFLKELDESTQKKIAYGEIEVRYTPIGKKIHSKIYRLVGNDESIVFVGSANLTESAFLGRQYEEIVGFDSKSNPQWCEYYDRRIKEIYEASIDFIPQSLKEKIIQKGNVNIIVPEDAINIIKDVSEQIRNKTPILPAVEMKNIIENLETTIKRKDEEIKIIKKEQELYSIVIKKKDRSGTGIILPKLEIEKNKDKIIQVLTKRKTIKGEFEDQRIDLRWDGRGIIKIYGEIAEPVEKPTDSKTLKEKLILLDKFIKAYDLLTAKEDKENTKRVFEAILYTFMSPFLWLLRKDFKDRTELLYKIPIFLLIAGKANTGKTHLLRFLSLAVGNNEQYYHYHSRTTISSYREIPPQIIEEFLREGNLCPIFVDEIDKAYFSSKNVQKPFMGESFIKEVSNTLVGEHPTVISTTNTTFQSDAQIIKRIYYIQLNNSFDTSKESESLRYFDEIRESFGTELFSDFIFRVKQKLNESEAQLQGDFLWVGREVFKEYFKELDMSTPFWFNSEPLRDYYSRGKNIWRMLYIRKKEIFEELARENKIVVKLDMEKRDRDDYIFYLPPETIIEDKGLLVLNREKFLEFINEDKSKLVRILRKIGLKS